MSIEDYKYLWALLMKGVAWLLMWATAAATLISIYGAVTEWFI